MHQLTSGQRRLFYQFDLNEAVPEDPLLRRSMVLSICPGSQRTRASLFVQWSLVEPSMV
jgi:hypothetical protein